MSSGQISLDRAVAGRRLGRSMLREVLPDLACRRLAIVNVVLWGAPNGREWVLIDAGIPGTAEIIRRAAYGRFGEVPPRAIVLTHGHFDHVGALRDLAWSWDVPIYAHREEMPFLEGRCSYPAPTRGARGLMAGLAPLYPRKTIDFGDRLEMLPDDGIVPPMPGWRWIATPGHTPGHVSLWREADRTLVAGDAVVTTRQERLWWVATQRPALEGPPTYFTPEATTAARSIARLAELAPQTLVSGHGPPLQGPIVAAALERLAERMLDFTRAEAVPGAEPTRTHERPIERPLH